MSCGNRHRLPELNETGDCRGLPVLFNGGDLSGKVGVPGQDGRPMVMASGEDTHTGLELASLKLPQ